jgi:hypothetical protein
MEEPVKTGVKYQENREELPGFIFLDLLGLIKPWNLSFDSI